MAEPLIITPKTKVLELITAYPQLEEVLIDFVPAFEKLKNPVLRKTVARVATLQQAAAVGGVKVEELVNRLRQAVGQDLVSLGDTTRYSTEKPAWFDPGRVAGELDAARMLAAGEQPVHEILAAVKALPPGAIYKVSAPFLPAPLIDKAASLGVQHWVVQQAAEQVVVYLCKPQR